MKKYTSHNEEETTLLASEFAQSLTGGEVVLLEGDLGAGKSVFVRGVARALNVEKRITSPTFVLMKVYDVEGNENVKRLVHVDAYRVEAEDLEAIGLREYMEDPTTVVFIEWGGKLKEYLSKKNYKVISINIYHAGEDTREITIQ